VLGGSADDTLIGDANGNLLWGNGGNDTIEGGIDSANGGVNNRDILVGGTGNDKITGGNGRDLILGGSGKDTLIGGDGDDILFSGTTTFDTDGTTQDLISTFWNTPDSATSSFSTRVSQLRNGTTGVANMPILNATTVFNDTSNDSLTGGPNSAGANDWYFAKISGSNQDSISGFAGGDALN
jgi:Ca2+-binding RTX toxin-like protein